MRVKRSLLAVLVCVVAMAGLAVPGAVGAEDDTPGTRPSVAAALPQASVQSLDAAPLLLAEPIEAAPVAPVVTESGLISLSVDAVGSNDASSIVSVEKPFGGTVRSAYLAAASTGFSGYQPQDGDVTLDGAPVVWDASMTMLNGISSVNVWADVTDLVKPTIDAAAAGRVDITVTEGEVTFSMDGSILAVIFDDPTVELDSTVVLAYGAQQVTGDSINLVRPPTVPSEDVSVTLGLGISFGFQPTNQDSTVSVNGELLTSSAGGQDDGQNSNGALITVGGLDDDPANPTDPTARGSQSSCPFCDDELYDLSGFVGTSAVARLELTTTNPSEDDNVFFAALQVVGADADWVPARDLRYNEVQQKSSHNSYERKEALMDQLVYHRIRSIELDLQSGGDAGQWYVSHDDKGGTTCYLLSDCLDELRAFHDANPSHEVVTVFLDLKDKWNDADTPVALDARLNSGRFVGAGNILTPSEVMGDCSSATTLVEAVSLHEGEDQVCFWPRLDELRGKFIFVLTGKTDRQNEYGTLGGSVAFIAPGINEFDSESTQDDAIFYNHKNFDADLAAAINEAGLVSRFYDLNGEDEFTDSLASVVHHLATDKVNFHEDPWAVTHNQFGWPFQVLDPVTFPEAGTFREAGNIISVDVTAEDDLWKKAPDRFHFAFVDTSGGADTWSALVSTPNSHTADKNGKGCLMARADLTDSAAYFSVCRLADDNELQVQWRDDDGDFESTEADIAPKNTVDEESLSFIRLRVTVNAAGETCFSGDGGLSPAGHPDSPDNGFELIDEHCFVDDLSFRGVASTSENKKEQTTFLYTNLTRNGSLLTVGGLEQFNVGSASTGIAFDGLWMVGDTAPLPIFISDFDDALDEMVQFPVPRWEGYGITRFNLFIMPQDICLIPGISATCGQGDNRGFVTGAEIGDWNIPARVKIIVDHEMGVGTVIAYRTHSGEAEVPALPIDLENVGNIKKLPPDFPSSFRLYGDGIKEIKDGGIGFDFRFVNSVTPAIVAGAAPAITGAVLIEQQGDGLVRVDYIGSPYPSLEVIRDRFNADGTLNSDLVFVNEQNVDDPWGLFGTVFHVQFSG